MSSGEVIATRRDIATQLLKIGATAYGGPAIMDALESGDDQGDAPGSGRRHRKRSTPLASRLEGVVFHRHPRVTSFGENHGDS